MQSRHGYWFHFTNSMLAVLLLQVATGAAAQTLRIGSATGSPGGAVAIPVSFEPGPNVVAGYQINIGYDRNNFGVPTIAPGAITICSVNDAAGHVTVIRDTFPPQPLGSETACTILFPIDATAALGMYTLSASNVVFADTVGVPVLGSVVEGRITVANGIGVAPQLSYFPAPDSDGIGDGTAEVRFFSDEDAIPALASIAIAATGGSAPGSTNLMCSISNGFTISAGGAQTIAAGGTATALDLSCTVGAIATGGALLCTETDSPGSLSRVRRWDLVCLAPLLNDSFE